MRFDLRDLPQRLEALVWGAQGGAQPPWQRHGLRAVRTLLVLGRDLALGQLTLRAMSLVYTTLLSIVPLLALSFSVLKAFGVTQKVEPLLLEVLEPLGERGVEIAARIASFIDNINVGVLGAVGLGLLLYTAVSLMQKIEESLNFIWHIPQPRPLAERFSRYLSVLLVGPILVFAALGLTATVANIEAVRVLLEHDALSQVLRSLGRLVPYLLVIAAFTFVYLFLPNARVRFVPALVGGAVGGIAWQTAGWLFAVFVASSGSYAAIYSGFAIVLLFMIWLYLSWLVLLFGASVAFYLQNPEYLYLGTGEPRLSNRLRERLALALMDLVVRRFDAGEAAPSQSEFTRVLGVPQHVLNTVLDALRERQLLVVLAQEPPQYVPARDPSTISVAQVLDAVRSAGESRFVSVASLPVSPSVQGVLEQAHAAVQSAVGDISLRALAQHEAPQAARVGDEAAQRIEPSGPLPPGGAH